jgi:hypothetical protein
MVALLPGEDARRSIVRRAGTELFCWTRRILRGVVVNPRILKVIARSYRDAGG